MQQASGARLSFIACRACDRAVRHLAPATGGVAQLAVGTAPADIASSVPGADPADPTGAAEAQALLGDLIHEYPDPLQGPDGAVYLVRVRGTRRTDGTWIGWLEFAE